MNSYDLRVKDALRVFELKECCTLDICEWNSKTIKGKDLPSS